MEEWLFRTNISELFSYKFLLIVYLIIEQQDQRE